MLVEPAVPAPESRPFWLGWPGDQPYLTRKRVVLILSVLATLLLAALGLSASVGNVPLRWHEVFWGAPGNVDRVIFFETRLPRIALAAIVGAALAVAGATLQGLLRNPLAEPHLIGVSGGAALGATLAVAIGGRFVLAKMWLLPLAAGVGALVSVALLYRISLVQGRLQPHVLLLAGVVYNAFAGAVILCVNYIADFYQAQGLLSWLIGNVAGYGYDLIGPAAVYCGLASLWLCVQARGLDLLSLGEESAWQMGVNVDRVRRVAFLGSSLLVGAVVAISGMIGFVGLIVPHALRVLCGADHRLLLPAAALGGAIFLVLADTIARSIAPGVEIPVGVVTALAGGPFFLYLLRREQRRLYF
ncbi:MAG: heme ABC transporter permease [Candidatus Binatia bacterium]|nr:MAG: heme ABC transporter permease [Candidatus Binatia bacterium]